jgi:flagellar hook-length control protein FliK
VANPMNVLPQAIHNPTAASPATPATNTQQSGAAKGKEKDSHAEFSAKLAQAQEKNGKAGATPSKDSGEKSSVKETSAKELAAKAAANSEVAGKGTTAPAIATKKEAKQTSSKEELDAALKAQALALASAQKPVIGANAAAEKIASESTGQDSQRGQEKNTKKASGIALAKTKLSPELNANLATQLQVQSQLKGTGAMKNPAAEAAMVDANPAHAKQMQALEQTPNQAMQAHELAGLAALQEQYSFEVDGSPTSAKPTAGLTKDAKAPTKLNTNDFLNLREMSQAQTKPVLAKDAISNPTDYPRFNQTANQAMSQFNSSASAKSAFGADAKKNKIESLSGAAGMQLHSGQVGSPNFAKVIDAPVTTGSQQKPVLSHDALHQISTQVNLLGLAKQDGEIKIRLRPDHLGELHMSVRTQGQSVSIQIQAHEGQAKKIIEASLSALKDSLAAQNLTLANVEIVTPTNSSSHSHDMNMQSDANSSRQNHDSNFNSNSEQNSRQDRLFEAEQRQGNLNTVRNVSFGRPASAASSTGLDLMAS